MVSFNLEAFTQRATSKDLKKEGCMNANDTIAEG